MARPVSGSKPFSSWKIAFRLLPRASLPLMPQRLLVTAPLVSSHELSLLAFAFVWKRMLWSTMPYRVTEDCAKAEPANRLPAARTMADFFMVLLFCLVLCPSPDHGGDKVYVSCKRRENLTKRKEQGHKTPWSRAFKQEIGAIPLSGRYRILHLGDTAAQRRSLGGALARRRGVGAGGWEGGGRRKGRGDEPRMDPALPGPVLSAAGSRS
ncbi:hypothetical protein CBM2600_A10200 [Cupriavidus taiwanensis]|nr:hypothetical protein CBM2600_A10200 [Cupriavidus taiwanensis]